VTLKAAFKESAGRPTDHVARQAVRGQYRVAQAPPLAQPEADVPSMLTSVYTAAMQTGGVGHYITGNGMISMISSHAPGICR
jgi:hypothetical protein